LPSFNSTNKALEEVDILQRSFNPKNYLREKEEGKLANRRQQGRRVKQQRGLETTRRRQQTLSFYRLKHKPNQKSAGPNWS